MAKGITPVKKVLQVKSPDMIPESATLEDYEKMAEKLASRSDEIIDRALDRLEGKPSKGRGRPKKEDAAEEPKVEVEPKTETAATETSESEAGAFSQQEEAPAIATVADANAQIDEKIRGLEAENERLKATVEDLTRQMSERVSEPQQPAQQAMPMTDAFEAEIASLSNKNDDLLLKNSELEFEISRLRVENNTLKQRIEQVESSNRLPAQTYSKEAYTRTPKTMRSIPNMPPPLRRGMNGYESWN